MSVQGQKHALPRRSIAVRFAPMSRYPPPMNRGSRSCRYCCKSPKLPGPKFLAVKKSYLRPPIDVAPITLPRSPASLSSGDEVPHIFTRKSRVQPKEFLISSAKRLLQQNLPGGDLSRCSKFVAYSITSSAVASRVGGTVRPSILAVSTLMTSSNFEDCTTGRSSGFAPLRMRPA
jgi:hypothetical protein